MHTWRRPDVLQHKHVLIMDAAIGLPLLLNVGVIILDTDTLWTQTGGSYAEPVTVAWDDGCGHTYM